MSSYDGPVTTSSRQVEYLAQNSVVAREIGEPVSSTFRERDGCESNSLTGLGVFCMGPSFALTMLNSSMRAINLEDHIQRNRQIITTPKTFDVLYLDEQGTEHRTEAIAVCASDALATVNALLPDCCQVVTLTPRTPSNWG